MLRTIDRRSGALGLVVALSAFVLLGASPAGAANPRLVKDIHPGYKGYGPAHLTAALGALYFGEDDGTHGEQLWTSDGTRASTDRLASVSRSNSFTASGGYVIFEASRNDVGTELFRTDGTKAGTKLVKDIWPGVCDEPIVGIRPCSSYPGRLTAFGGFVFFTARSDPSQKYLRLGRTDGTAGGTSLWMDVCAGEHVVSVRAIGGALYLACAGELWKSDGTDGGTHLVTDIAPGSDGELSLTGPKLGDDFYFVGDDGIHGPELWRSDGTEDGTRMVKDLLPGRMGGFPDGIIKFHGRLYFKARHPTKGAELWVSDGTSKGTHVLRDIVPGGGSSVPRDLTRLGDRFVFAASGERRAGRELYVSDGTKAGTHLLKDLWTTPRRSSDPGNLLRIGLRIYFSASRRSTGYELWITNGTAAGTKLVADIRPGADGSGPNQLTRLRGRLYFAAGDQRGREPWRLVP